GDIGLKNLLTGFQPEAIYGQLENIVYLELLSRGYSVDIGKLYDTEVDFIAKRGDQRTYIQVAYLLADQKTIDREFGSLEKIPDNHPKLVLSMDRFPMGGRNGIQWKYLIDFLLEQE
ncbi:MAG: ATP-binding protein, partial [Bacteroidales bacterium]|nr:ATP-binding protein [Bacteroidales bacterium]